MDIVESIKHIFLDTGAGWVMWLLAGLSVASVAVTIERWWVYRQAAGDLNSLSLGLQQKLAEGGELETAQWLESSASMAARVAAAGLRLSSRGPAAVNKAMVSRTALERDRLERKLAFLGTLGNNAPFIGLFGTVIGVIQAFEELGRTSAAGAAMAGQVASGAVMSAIAEALVATAVGIAVALPAVAAYNYLQQRVEQMLSGVEVLSNLVLAYLESEPRRTRALDGDGRQSGKQTHAEG